MKENVREKKRWSWWSKLLLLFSPIFVLLVIVMGFEAGGTRAYNRVMEEAREIGGPVTIEELEVARKSWPDERNGALIITSLTTQPAPAADDPVFESLPLLGNGDLPPLGEKWSDQTDQIVRDHLARLSADIEKINKLANCEGGRFPIQWTPNPFDTLLPNLAQVRMSCKLKSLQVIQSAMHGNTASLVTDLDILLRHGRTLADEPTLISGLVHVATDSLAIDVLQRVLGQTSVSTEQIRQMETLVKAVEDEDRLYWGIRGERAALIRAVNWLTTGGARGLPGMVPLALPAHLPGMRGWVKSDLAEAIRLESSLVKAQNAQQRMQAASQVEAAVIAMPRYRVLTKTLTPSMKRAFELDLKATATVLAARTALAAERYRLEKGRFPDKLEDLVPIYLEAVPFDPFNGKPMRYRVDPDGLIVYSIGEDKRDDGGKVQLRVPRKTTPSDWGFVLLSSEFRGRPASTTAPATSEAEATATLREESRTEK